MLSPSNQALDQHQTVAHEPWQQEARPDVLPSRLARGLIRVGSIEQEDVARMRIGVEEIVHDDLLCDIRFIP
jgi:hypothetical protein